MVFQLRFMIITCIILQIFIIFTSGKSLISAIDNSADEDIKDDGDSDLYFNGNEDTNKDPDLTIREEDIPKNGELFEGDIIMDEAFRRALLGEENKRAAVYSSEVGWYRHWVDGVVPYVLDDSLPPSVRRKIPLAIKILNHFTCVRWVHRHKHKHVDYVRFMDGNGCSSSVGRVGGEQVTHLAKGCRRLGTILHEMMHVLGIIHEQSRPDRDKYLNINFRNIQPGLLVNFQRYSFMRADTLGVPYNYYSVMHYGNKAFSRNGGDTMGSTYDPRLKFGQRKMLTHLDVEQINRLYPCAKDLSRMRRCINTPCEGRLRCCLVRDMTPELALLRRRKRENMWFFNKWIFGE